MANQIKLSYTSPDSPSFTFTESLPARPTNPTATATATATAPSSPAEKQAYLSALRAAVTNLQDKTNTELTARMETDKIREAAAKQAAEGGGGSKNKSNNGKGGKEVVDEAAEEENYGEEVVDDEDD